jgi:2-dehydropantoate 2-reductase
MKTVVVGAGAMGTFIAARLFMSGHEVWLLEVNDKRVTKIKEKGICLEENDDINNLKFSTITSDPKEIGVADAVIIMVKAFDTEDAVKLVLPAISEGTIVLTLQNGMGNIELIRKYISKERVMAGTTSHGALLIHDGHVRHTGVGDTIIGALSADSEKHTGKLKALFDASGINTSISDDANSLLWGKLLINMSINPLTAIMRIKNGRIVELPHLVEIIKQMLVESLEVATKIGVNIPYDNPLEKIIEVCRNTSQNCSSMFQDILAGRRTEINQINGAIVTYGLQCGIETPVNKMLTELVMSIEQIRPVL